MLAVDGSRIEEVYSPLRRSPSDAGRVVLSVGGNVLLAEAAIVSWPAGGVGQAMLMLAEVQDQFEALYTRLIEGVAALGRPTVVCTIHEPRFPDAFQRGERRPRSACSTT